MLEEDRSRQLHHVQQFGGLTVTPWLNNGTIVIENGVPVICDTCPCDTTVTTCSTCEVPTTISVTLDRNGGSWNFTCSDCNDAMDAVGTVNVTHAGQLTLGAVTYEVWESATGIFGAGCTNYFADYIIRVYIAEESGTCTVNAEIITDGRDIQAPNIGEFNATFNPEQPASLTGTVTLTGFSITSTEGGCDPHPDTTLAVDFTGATCA